MILASKAPDGTYSYVAKMPNGEIVLGGDGCDGIEEIQNFFADLASIATDTPCDYCMIHVKLVDNIDLPVQEDPKVTTSPEAIYPLGGTDLPGKKMSAPQPKKAKKAKK